jgi:membrane protease YdiL (CAAX protease family)
LSRLGPRGWVLIAVAFVIVQVGEISLSGTGAFFARLPLFSTPDVLPELFDPQLDIEAGLTTFFAVPVRGNWWLVVFWLGWLIVNVGGEELLWRGYALPLQERYFGKYAWLVNGLCWNLLIHAFMRWNFLTLMPISLVIPYLVQRTKNTWIGIYIHGFGNLLVLVILVPSIAGWI